MIHPNKFKFLKAPTIEQIEEVVKKAGVSEAQFERFYNIFDGAIRQHRHGHRTIPARYWHLFLEDTNMVPNSVSKSVSTLKSSKPKQKKPSADSRLNKLV